MDNASPGFKVKSRSAPPDMAESHHITVPEFYIFYFLEDKAAGHYFAPGEMAEWSIAAVLKTVDC